MTDQNHETTNRKPEPSNLAGPKILLVEDNALNRELVVDLLEMESYCVLQAISGEQGLALARAEKPDLILMDMQLPGLDGLAITRLLKSDPATRDIPVIALTAYAMRGDDEKVYQAGCVAYIPKPIDTRQFAATLARFLKLDDR